LLADEQLVDSDIKTMNQGKAASLHDPITYKELCNTVKQKINSTSPGLDGYTVEVFIFFWQDPSSYILHAINNAYEEGELSVMHRRE